MWDDEKFVAFDFETSGTLPEYALQPWRVTQGKAWATSLAVVRKVDDRLQATGGLNPTPQMMREFLTEARDAKRRIVGWNTVFDISWLLAYGLDELVFQNKWLDGMLLWRHYAIEPEYETTAPKKKSYGLKACVAEVLPQFAGYEQDIDFHDPSPEARKRLHKYNVQDTAFTLRLAKHWWGKLTPAQQRAALIEAECLPMVAQANLRGLLVDTLATRQLRAHLCETASQKLASLAKHGVTEKIVRSPPQMAKLLFDDWGLPVLKENTSKLTGKVTRSTDKEVLHELAFTDPRAKELREYREALNNCTKFADAPLESVDYCNDGCTHPQAIVFGTYSGRLTYASKQGKNKDERQTGFALHQEKRGAEFRAILVPPPGYTLMEFDASGQEFRWMAIASEDPTMLSLCAPGEDAHAYMGARIAQVDYPWLMAALKADEVEIRTVAKDARQLGKVGNLSLQYRTSARKLRVVARVQYSIPMELSQAQRIHATYQRTYPKVPKYWDMQIRDTRQKGYVETFAGRRVQVIGNWDGNNGWSMGSTAINYKIQGCLQGLSRVMTKSGLVPIRELLGQVFEVWTGHQWAYATAVSRGVCRLAEIELVTGEIIYCDTRHKLKTDARTWLSFDALIPGVHVALPRLRSPLKATTKVTWPYILGSYLGDGWVYEHKRTRGWARQVGFAGGIGKLENLNRIKLFFTAEGFETKLRQIKPTVWVLYSDRRDLFDALVARGVTPNLRARTKFIPESVWRMNEQDRRDFWEGVCHTDGARVKGQEHNIHTPNLRLLQELQKFVASLGIASHITETSAAWLLRILRIDGGYYPRDRLRADFGDFVPPCRAGDCESIVDRRAVLGPQQVTQRVAERIYDRWRPDLEVYRYAKIKDVRVLDEEAVTYTLAVDDPLHQFIADGVVHKNTGADQKYLALAVTKPYLTQIGAYFAWDLHDGIYLYVPDAMVARAAVEIKRRLDNLPYARAWGFTPPIALPWDCKTGGSWGALKEWKDE